MPPTPPSVSGPTVAVDGDDATPAATTTASVPSTIATMTRVSSAVLCTPRRLTAVSATTAPMPSGRASSGAT